MSFVNIQFSFCGSMDWRPKILSITKSPRQDGDGLGGVPLGFVFDICYESTTSRPGTRGVTSTFTSTLRCGSWSPQTIPILTWITIPVPTRDGGCVVNVRKNSQRRLDDNYGIYTFFATWTLPLDIPERWRSGNTNYNPSLTSKTSEVSFEVKVDDRAYLKRTGSDPSRILGGPPFPDPQDIWGHNPSSELNSTLNEVSLRADLHAQFDQALFFFIPYAGPQTLCPLPLKAGSFSGTDPPWPFVHFAWNLFKLWGSELAAAVESIGKIEKAEATEAAGPTPDSLRSSALSSCIGRGLRCGGLVRVKMWSKASIHWIVPVIGAALYLPGVFLVFQSILVYATAAYPVHAASVLAGNDFFRFAIASVFPKLLGDKQHLQSLYKSTNRCGTIKSQRTFPSPN
ncbi:hypothetical protein GGX14DRAFT_655532 [Mycena pura]|uniref:HNH nuclease domain-containing protein n=1 Tax=Mycena pura TaxID=153505 RepID=A0AAD6V3T9_9AGAR|nr:hypothetical protein GGX14DRAFT_655532 [Mycena pura]